MLAQKVPGKGHFPDPMDMHDYTFTRKWPRQDRKTTESCVYKKIRAGWSSLMKAWVSIIVC